MMSVEDGMGSALMLNKSKLTWKACLMHVWEVEHRFTLERGY